jgi:heme oxygenase (mycobilin-producing)
MVRMQTLGRIARYAETNLGITEEIMAVRVFIEREIQPGNDLKLHNLLMQLRTKAMLQKGYITGETLRDVSNPNKFLVIGTWNSIEDWNTWQANPERKKLQGELDKLLKAPEKFGVYTY